MSGECGVTGSSRLRERGAIKVGAWRGMRSSPRDNCSSRSFAKEIADSWITGNSLAKWFLRQILPASNGKHFYFVTGIMNCWYFCEIFRNIRRIQSLWKALVEPIQNQTDKIVNLTNVTKVYPKSENYCFGEIQKIYETNRCIEKVRCTNSKHRKKLYNLNGK